MKKNIIKLLLSTVYFIMTVTAEAQKDTLIANHQPDTVISNKQIKESIQTFIKLIASDDPKQYGLKNAAELNSLRPGKQFRKYMISLKDVKQYEQGHNVGSIIKEYPAVEVSLVSNTGKMITSIEFVYENGIWEASRFGSTPELVLVNNVQDVIGDSIIKKGKLVRIPSLNVSFIAVLSGSALKFISLQERPDLKLGESIPASDAILRLKPLANEHKNFPN